ncbi:MAG: WecB/TagA/CpsF family glycosyltransferase [Bacilli bacterium]
MKKIFKKIYNKSKLSYFKILSDDLRMNRKKFIVTINPETLIMSEKDLVLKKLLLDKNTSIVPDGISVVKASKKVGFPIIERITGIDIASFLLDEGNSKKKTIYLFGAKKEVIETLVKKIREKYTGLKILGYSDGYANNRDDVFEKIIKLKPDICLVALGIPDQEKIIYKHLNKFTKGIFVGVGGSFDVISETKKRAPIIFINLNLEWLYRLIKEPKRIKRFLKNNIKFLFKLKK